MHHRPYTDVHLRFHSRKPDPDEFVERYLAPLHEMNAMYGEVVWLVFRGMTVPAALIDEMCMWEQYLLEARPVSGELIRRIENVPADSEDLRNRRLGQFFFVQLSQEQLWAFDVLVQWHTQVMTQRPTSADWRSAWTETALRAAKFAGIQRDASNHPEYFSKESEGVRGFRQGLLTEFDTIISLQYMCMKHPEYLVMAAPAQFEDWNAKYNVDFLVLRMTDGQVIGVQAKSVVRDEHVARYDTKRVLLWDARNDMEETEWRQTSPKWATMREVVQPGLVSTSAAASITWKYLLARYGMKIDPETSRRLTLAKQQTKRPGHMLEVAARHAYARIEDKLGPVRTHRGSAS